MERDGCWSWYFWYCYVGTYEQLNSRLEAGLGVGYSSLVCEREAGFHLRRMKIEAPGPRFPEAEKGLASDTEQYE